MKSSDETRKRATVNTGMTLPDLDQLRLLLDLCASKGVASIKVGELEVAFAPQAYTKALAAAGALKGAHADDDEVDEEQERYEREMKEWQRTQGLDDDPAVDG